MRVRNNPGPQQSDAEAVFGLLVPFGKAALTCGDP